MTIVLSIAVLMIGIGSIIMPFTMWKILRKIDRTADRISDTLDHLSDLIKHIASDGTYGLAEYDKDASNAQENEEV